MKKAQNLNRHFQRSPLAAAVVLSLLAAPMAQAFEFERGEFKGSLDTTVSYGVSVRAEDPDCRLISKANGYVGPGCVTNPLVATQGAFLPDPNPLTPVTNPVTGAGNEYAPFGKFTSPAQVVAPGSFGGNSDDGNVKYQKGDITSNTFKVTSELEMSWRDWGVFSRASYFYDFENAGREDMSEAALKKVGTDFRLYDAFIWKNYSLGANDEIAGSIRFGKQVVSWGESTFIQGGINVVNPVDASRLRIAGSEVKEAFLPTNMLWGSTRFSESLSLEAYYQFNWRPVETDPAGTYLSTNDYASIGGTYLMLGLSTSPVINPDLYGGGGAFNSKLPVGACIVGVGAAGQVNVSKSDKYQDFVKLYGATTATALLQGACAGTAARIENRWARDSGQFGLAFRWYAEALNQTEFGFYAMNYHSRLPVLSGKAITLSLPSPATNTVGLIVEYPEDIHLFGISFNTTIPGGIAWQGEVSYRPNQPFQVDDTEVIQAALSPNNQLFRANGFPKAALFNSQLGEFSSGAYVKGWDRHEITQLQMTFTKAFSNILGAESINVVGEVGATQVSLPDASILRYEAEGSIGRPLCDVAEVLAQPGYPGSLNNPANTGCLRNSQRAESDIFATDFSWGYRLVALATYNGVFGSPINLTPRIAFNHDVQGIAPGPGGNFREGRQSAVLGLEANYLSKIYFDLSYSGFWGAEGYNSIGDRDFYSFSVKYSF